jgi:GDP-4-dehydro-6-deoxy-D-mannose reductase
VAGIARGRRPPLVEVGNLDVRRDLCDVRDVVRGYALALERGRSGEAYNLCSGRSTSIREILELLCEIGGVRVDIRPVAARLRGREVPAVFGNAAKAQVDLGWQPEISLRRTLEDVLARAFAEETAAV